MTKEKQRQELEAIIRDLAAMERPTDSEWGYCTLCKDWDGHDDDCPQQRAIQWVKYLAD